MASKHKNTDEYLIGTIMMPSEPCRHILLILGDQLDEYSAALAGADSAQDVVLMIEATEESTHVWSHKIRTTLFLSAMRHFAQGLTQRGWRVHYRALDVEADQTLADGLQAAVKRYHPERIIGIEPGDLRVKDQIENAIDLVASNAHKSGVTAENSLNERHKQPKRPILEWREDKHFLCSLPQFRQWAGSASSLRMEYFYRSMRKQYKVLMDGDDPVGGQWNFDADNRKSFGKTGPHNVPKTPTFAPDHITQDVIKLVNKCFSDHPGTLDDFNWPVTRSDALQALQSFVNDRLPQFGPYEDAMWTGLNFGWHSLLSSSLNLKLISPLEVVQAAEAAYFKHNLDLASVEGFIRQVLGWREFMRGVYFLDMPGLKTANHYRHAKPLPSWYWTGDTKMNCMKQSITQTLEKGYSHHIQRLMITGMFGVTAQISPQALCDWYLAVYVDAVEWVELPNTAGMALFANGGRFTSKPYVASGAYVKRMSNYCSGCTYRPEAKTGANACPMTTLYWNFLDQHEAAFAANPRTALMVKNLQRMTPEDRAHVRDEAKLMLKNLNEL